MSRATTNEHSIDRVNDTDDLIRILRISRGTLNKLIQSKELRTYKIGRRRFASDEAVTEFIRAREAEAAA